MNWRPWKIACLLLSITVATTPTYAVIVNGSGQITASGSDLALYLGADRFYAAGYTGTRATLGNVEGYLPWTGHQSLTHVGIIPPAPGVFHATTNHPTGVSSIMAARGNRTLDRGIAYGASLYAGSVSFIVNPSTEQFGPTRSTVGNTYTQAAQGFIPIGLTGTVAADVINSSWGFTTQFTGASEYTWSMDAVAARSGKLFVSAAGNSGPAAGTVAEPGGAMLNGLTVGALQSDTPPETQPAYNRPATFSSRSPTPITLPGIGTFTRAAVSIAAPGTNFSVAGYKGSGTPQNWYYFNVQGTSYASPTVAGGAGLLVDVGYDRYVTPTDRTAIDARVLKAVLMNSASKTVGWDNGQHLVSGVTTTTQALDYSVGTGRLDLARAFTQYTSGTAGVSESPTGITSVATTGWDFDSVGPSDALDRLAITSTLTEGSTFTATLTWFSANTYNDATAASSFDALANLSLEVWCNNALVALSNTFANTVEHLTFLLPETGQYELRVTYLGMDLGSPRETPYALAWSTDIPEPVFLSGFILPLFFTRRRRRPA